MQLRSFIFLSFLAINIDIRVTAQRPRPKDVLFLIDGSGSVKPHNFDILRQLLKAIVDGFDNETNVALIQFSSRQLTKVEFNLDTYDNKEDIKKAIDDMVYQQKYTYTGYAMKLARTEVFNSRGGDRPNAKNVLLIFTDGEAADPHIARRESKELKSNGAHVMSVGFGPEKSVEKFRDELEEMASTKDKDVFVRGFQDLDNIKNRLLEAVRPKRDCSTSPCKNGGKCTNYKDSFTCECTEDYKGFTCEKKKGPCDKTPCLNNGACIEGMEYDNGYKCVCSEPFYGNSCQKKRVVCKTKNADILFVMDGSASIVESDFRDMKKFITKLVYRFNISRDESHVGLIQFSNRHQVDVEFHLDDYYLKEEIMEKIANISHQKGLRTHTDIALKVAREKIFSGTRGDRKGTRDVIVLLTDGEAHEKEKAIEEATKLKDADVSIISIGVGRGEIMRGLQDFLKKVSSNPGYVFKVSYSKLETILDGVIRAACENLGDV